MVAPGGTEMRRGLGGMPPKPELRGPKWGLASYFLRLGFKISTFSLKYLFKRQFLWKLGLSFLKTAASAPI